MAYEDEIRQANTLGSHSERFAARNAVRAKYGMPPERRKRGGLAGMWDRNKSVIKPVATGLAGLLGTPALGAAVGASFGFDRPGKGGIGYDVGKGAMGALQGYGTGKLGSLLGAKAGIGKLGALEGAGKTVSGGVSKIGGMLGVGGEAPVAGGTVAANHGTLAAPLPLPSGGSKLASAGSWLAKHPEVAAGALGAYSTLSEGASDRDIANRRLEFEERQYAEDRADRERRATIARQLYDQMMGQMSWNRGGANG